jgi:hypothetical protein
MVGGPLLFGHDADEDFERGCVGLVNPALNPSAGWSRFHGN